MSRRSPSLALWAMELRLFARARFTLLGFVLLLLAMTWGALNGREAAREQGAAIERIRLHEAAALAESRAALERHARTGPRLPYWQDPGDVSGYMRYGLQAFAVKPPSSLAPLAVGQSRLQPYYLRVELDHLSPPDAAYDFVNPGLLGLGEFDLAFVLVYLLPLALIAIGAPCMAEERDAGMLPLLAAGNMPLRRVALLKFGAMAAVCLPAVLLCTACALLVAEVPLHEASALRTLAFAAFGLAGYTLLWCAVTAAVASRAGLVASYLGSAAIWAAWSLLVPAAIALAVGVAHPLPSALRHLDDVRRESSLAPAQRDALFLAHVRAHADYAAAAGRLKEVSYAAKQIAVQGALERRLAPHRASVDRARRDAARMAQALRTLSPAMLMDTMLQTAAGTDHARHLAFLEQNRAYTAQLRAFFWPRALREAAAPNDACPGCATRMNFREHAAIPRFVPAPPKLDEGRAIGQALCLWLPALLAIAAIVRGERGPLP